MRWLLVLLLGAGGCMNNHYGRFDVAAADPISAPITILATGVEGSDCVVAPLGLDVTTASYRAAALDAIATVPGGTLLTDASVDFKYWELILFQIRCARVSGDVGRF